MKLIRLAAAICLCSCLQTFLAFACRYNVHDIGFVDLGDSPYHFYGYVNQDTPAQITSDLTQISQAAFSEANISIEIIDADRQKDNPAIKYLDLWPAQSFPAAVLVSPDGQSLPVPVTSSNEPFEQTLRAALRGIVSSPAREELLRHVSNDHGVVLLIEGTNAEENTSARKADA